MVRLEVERPAEGLHQVALNQVTTAPKALTPTSVLHRHPHVWHLQRHHHTAQT